MTISMCGRRNGFTVAEVTIVSGLMAVLALVVSSAWSGVGRTTWDLIGRSRLVQERDLAVAALCRDLGGCLVDCEPQLPAQLGGKATYRWLNWAVSNNSVLWSNQDLTVTYDDGAGGNVTVAYQVKQDPDPNAHTLVLVRSKAVNGSTRPPDFTVAKNLLSMTITPNPITTPLSGADVEIVLCFAYGLDKVTGAPNDHTLTLTCDLTAKQPSGPCDTPNSQTWTINHLLNQ